VQLAGNGFILVYLRVFPVLAPLARCVVDYQQLVTDVVVDQLLQDLIPMGLKDENIEICYNCQSNKVSNSIVCSERFKDNEERADFYNEKGSTLGQGVDEGKVGTAKLVPMV
jgi:hypothetical protein